MLDEVEIDLKEAYGAYYLEAFDGDVRGRVDLEGFVLGAYPAQVLDVVEAAVQYFEENERRSVEGKINQLFLDEECPWQIANGYFFMVDSKFLQEHLIRQSEELLSAPGFAGPLQEFREARSDLTDGRIEDAIHKAEKSYESLLKAILKRDGTPDTLIPALRKEGMFDDVPVDAQKAICGKTLFALPVIRHKLGGHGQGAAPRNVPRAYAELAVHLAAAFHHFLISKEMERRSAQPIQPLEDDLPF